jgi:hypothetical protein
MVFVNAGKHKCGCCGTTRKPILPCTVLEQSPNHTPHHLCEKCMVANVQQHEPCKQFSCKVYPRSPGGACADCGTSGDAWCRKENCPGKPMQCTGPTHLKDPVGEFVKFAMLFCGDCFVLCANCSAKRCYKCVVCVDDRVVCLTCCVLEKGTLKNLKRKRDEKEKEITP